MALCKIDLDGLALVPWNDGFGGGDPMATAVAVPAPLPAAFPSTQSM